ncbi:MAG: hypothetical protein OXE05_06915 [Chloroflexi bacterium]|nr:hypothetical protein [Chloroflexota bacterium]
MKSEELSEQDAASLTGPRALKEPGDVLWCWQTISALQSIWKSLNLDFERYMRTWAEAEEHAIWEKVPPRKPFGTKEVMLKALEIGNDVAARSRVAVQAMPARPLNPVGSTGATYLITRISRDRPDILERMKNGEFKSVAAAAREAGVLKPRPKSVALLGNPKRVAANIKKHYTPEQVRALKDAL